MSAGAGSRAARPPKGGKIAGMNADLPTHSMLLRLGKAYNTATQSFEAATGVSAARWRLLYLIALQSGISQRQLIRQVRVDPGSITRQLRVLQDDGLIERRADPADARLMLLLLTRAGRTEVARVMRLRRQFLAEMVDGVSERDLRTAMKVLDRICVNLGDDAPLPATPQAAAPVKG